MPQRRPAMVVLRWTFLLGTLLAIAAVFMPSVVVDRLGRHASVSLYRAQADRELGVRFVASYQRRSGRGAATALVTRAMADTGGRAHDMLDDTQSAMETLDGLTPDDARLYGRVASVAVWLELAVLAAGFLLVLGDTIQIATRLRRLIGGAALGLVALAIAVAAHLVCGEVVFEANDEIGAAVLALGSGAFVLPVACAVALVALAAAIVLEIRAMPPRFRRLG